MTGMFARTVLFYTVLDKCVSFSGHCSARPITFSVGCVLAAQLDTAS